jgi:hypothetical protein
LIPPVEPADPIPEAPDRQPPAVSATPPPEDWADLAAQMIDPSIKTLDAEEEEEAGSASE